MHAFYDVVIATFQSYHNMSIFLAIILPPMSLHSICRPGLGNFNDSLEISGIES